jgi:hypothetical protein
VAALQETDKGRIFDMADEPENLTLRLLREMRQETNQRFDAVEQQILNLSSAIGGVVSAIGELKTDVKELTLVTGLLEIRMSKVTDRLDRIEKHLGPLKV